MVNGTFIKKSKMQYAKEVASIKPLELFGIESCEVSWEGLFKKHLAFDVLECGSLSCDETACLENEIGKNCNC